MSSLNKPCPIELKKSILELIKAGIDPNTISIQKLKMEYDLTLAVLTDYIEKEKEALELEKQREQAQNKLSDIIKNYTRKLEELGKTDIEIQQKRAIEIVEALKLEDDAVQEAVNAINKYFDTLKSTDAADEFELTTEKIISQAENLAGALISLSNSIIDNRIADLDRQLQEELRIRGLLEETESQRLQREIQEAEQAGNTTLALEKRQDLERLQVIEEFERKKSLLQYKAAFAEWLLKIASVGASAAEAIMKAWAT